MYLSRKHKLLFIAIPRTASNSTQRALLNSDITDPTDIVYSLGRDPRDFDSIEKYHISPQAMVDSGIISLDELLEYKCFGFVREPLERWVSSVFLARYTGVLDNSVDPLEQMCDLVRNGPNPRPFARNGKSPEFRQPDYKPFTYRKFLYVGDTKVLDVYQWKDVETVTNNILSEKLGYYVSVDFPHIKMNPEGVPAQFREPIENWFPTDCREKLLSYFSEDIEIYNSMVSA